MTIQITVDDEIRTADLDKPLDLSIPMESGSRNPRAWMDENPQITPVVSEQWEGSVASGASVNFNNVWFNPHAHGTHTECLGHITEKVHSVNRALERYFFLASVITVAPESKKGDKVISARQLRNLLKGGTTPALVIRTLPNIPSKKRTKYMGTNWPYLEATAAKYLREKGVEHLLIDQPSVDKEKDDGKLAAHKAFWGLPENPRQKATITEFIYVSNRIADGIYLLELQTAPFVNDATPSRPLLYRLQPIR